MNIVEPIREISKIEEIRNILLKNGSRDCFLFVFGINIGLRISDILPLQVKDVKYKEHISLREGKTNKYRRIYINYELRGEINNYIKGLSSDDFLFPSQKGGHIGRIRAYEILRDAGLKAGLKSIGTHTLRKTFGYHFYKTNKDVALLQSIFNHSSPSITLSYIGISQDEIDEAVKGFSIGIDK